MPLCVPTGEGGQGPLCEWCVIYCVVSHVSLSCIDVGFQASWYIVALLPVPKIYLKIHNQLCRSLSLLNLRLCTYKPGSGSVSVCAYWRGKAGSSL